MSISTRKVVWGLSPVLTMFSPYGDVTIAGGEELKPLGVCLAPTTFEQ